MIRKISREDIYDAAYIHSESWKESHKGICSDEFIKEHTPSRQQKYLEGLIEENVNIYMLRLEYPVAIISIRDNMIENLYVLPSEQNKGYGTMLIKYAIGIIKGNKAIPRLRVMNVNVKAKKLYEKLGFRENGVIKRLSDTLYEIELIMEK